VILKKTRIRFRRYNLNKLHFPWTTICVVKRQCRQRKASRRSVTAGQIAAETSLDRFAV
jgi:hypothetical protein